MEFTDREKQVIQCWLDSWDLKLPGHLSYNDALKLIIKLGLDEPPKIVTLLNERSNIEKVREVCKQMHCSLLVAKRRLIENDWNVEKAVRSFLHKI